MKTAIVNSLKIRLREFFLISKPPLIYSIYNIHKSILNNFFCQAMVTILNVIEPPGSDKISCILSESIPAYSPTGYGRH